MIEGATSVNKCPRIEANITNLFQSNARFAVLCSASLWCCLSLPLIRNLDYLVRPAGLKATISPLLKMPVFKVLAEAGKSYVGPAFLLAYSTPKCLKDSRAKVTRSHGTGEL